MSQLNLANVINISVAQAQRGIGKYNTSNLAIMSDESPITPYTGGYKIYLSATEVAADYATGSKTAAMAANIFSQSPNILTGGGYLVVITMLSNISAVIAHQLLSYSTVPTTGSYQLGYAGNYTADIDYDDDAAAVQAALRLVAGLGSVTVTGTTAAGFAVVLTGVSGPAPLITVRNDSMQDTDGYDVFIAVTTTQIGVAAGSDETVGACITRTKNLVQYFGILANAEIADNEITAAAAVVQPLNKIAFFAKRLAANVAATTGIADTIRLASYTKTRILLYLTEATDDEASVLMAAAYAGRALSTNFSGSNTTQTMHMKDLVGVLPDEEMTQTIFELTKTAGADTYSSFQGVPKVYSTGANGFFDDIYNLCWLVGALEVAGFNYLAQSSNKIPQTEDGVDGLKGAYRSVLEQALRNLYCAPGSWNSPDTFGDLEDFHRNIGERGYYIYSLPVNLQSQVDRAARQAPLIQIAAKQAGAIHSSSVIVYINA